MWIRFRRFREKCGRRTKNEGRKRDNILTPNNPSLGVHP